MSPDGLLELCTLTGAIILTFDAERKFQISRNPEITVNVATEIGPNIGPAKLKCAVLTLSDKQTGKMKL